MLVSSPGIRTWSFDLRRVACESATLRGQFRVISASPRNRTSSCSFEDCRAIRHTRRRIASQYPDLESNQDLDLRRVRCDPLHHRDKFTRADDWICTSIIRFTRPPPFSVEPRRQKHECEESNPVRRLWRPLALPGAHSCKGPRTVHRGRWRNDYSSSVTFQYASLMNFDQLSIRTRVVGVQRLPRRPDRLLAQPHAGLLAASGRPSACCSRCTPARSSPSSTCHPATAARRGRSSIPRCPAGQPQYWQV